MAKDTTTKTPAAPKPVALDFSKVRVDFAIPVEALSPQRAPTANALPFAEHFFTPQAEAALNGAEPFFFVPTAFWLPRAKEVEAAKEPNYGKDKLKGQFKAWQKKDEAKRGPLTLLVHHFTGKEGVEGITEPGTGMWMKNPSYKPPAKPEGNEEAPATE